MKYHSYWWCDLSKSSREGQDGGWFKEVVRWRVCSGDKVRFWDDAWAGCTPLINTYRRLYFVSMDKGMMVADVGEWEDSVWHWGLKWRRDSFQWETTQEEGLLRLLERVKLLKEVKDRQVWDGDESGDFSVKKAYARLANHGIGLHQNVFRLFLYV